MAPRSRVVHEAASVGESKGKGYAVESCALCGATVEEVPLTWTSSVERGRKLYYCERCSRENVRAIEGRLDAEWF